MQSEAAVRALRALIGREQGRVVCGAGHQVLELGRRGRGPGHAGYLDGQAALAAGEALAIVGSRRRSAGRDEAVGGGHGAGESAVGVSGEGRGVTMEGVSCGAAAGGIVTHLPGARAQVEGWGGARGGGKQVCVC